MKARLFAFFILILGSAISQEPGYLVIESQKSLPYSLVNEESTLRIRLKNNLEACLISDANAKEASVSLVVGVGSWSDPDQSLGLAHYLEHMLFMGTKKYPDPLDYQRFLAEHGGKANAMTMENGTMYYFNIDHSGLEAAMDRFARAFYEPLLLPSAMQKEIQVIDQEFAIDCASPFRCQKYVVSQLYHPQHPASHFSGGNKVSLRDVSDADLRDWFNQHYSANRMKLVVYSALPLEKIAGLVAQYFSAIPDRGVHGLKVNTPILSTEQKKTITYVKSPLQGHSLSILWHLPACFSRNLKAKSEEIVANLLNRKDDGSLYAWLKEEGLIESLSCCSKRIHEDLSILELDFSLTSKGLSDVESIILYCLEATKQLERLPITDHLLQEIQLTSFLKLQQIFKNSPQSILYHFSDLLAYEDISKFPDELLLIQSPSPEEIRQLLRHLSYENALISVLTSDPLPFDRVDRWLHHAFTVKPFSSGLIEKLNQIKPSHKLSLPVPNRFLSTRHFHTNNHPITQEEFLSLPPPCEIINHGSMHAYFSPASIFSYPRSFIRVNIMSPRLNKSDPYTPLMQDLFITAWQDIHRPLLSEARKASLYCLLTPIDGGLQLTIAGPQDSIERFIDLLDLQAPLKAINNLELYKNALAKDYEHFLVNYPLEVAKKATHEMLKNRPATLFNTQDLLKKLDKKRFQQFLSKLFVRTFSEGLILSPHSSEGEARILMENLQKKVGGKPYSFTAANYSNQNNQPVYVKTNLEGTESAALLLIGLDKRTPQEKNIQELLCRILKTSFFAELRTEQQVAYVVMQEEFSHHNRYFLSFGVRSSSHDSLDLLHRYEFFIERFLKNLTHEEIPPARFMALKQTLMTELTAIPKDILQWGEQLFSMIFEKNNVHWNKQRIEALKNLSYEDFIQSTRNILGRQNKCRLAVLMNGQPPLDQQFRYVPYRLAKQGGSAL
ncbi:MAG: insulinase family protein [Parachlamydiaceae bacterium]